MILVLLSDEGKTNFCLGNLPAYYFLMETTMADAIQTAIEAAKGAAASTPTAANANAAQALATTAPSRAAPLSAADMMTGSFSVDAFLKVTEDGIKIGDKAGLITESFEVVIDLSTAFYYYAMKYGNPASYEKTQDQVRSLSGKPWPELLAQAVRVDGDKFKGSYRSGDIAMKLLTDVKDFKGALVETAGTVVGKSLSTTEWKEWEAFLRSVMKAGLNADTAEVRAVVTSKQKKNNAGNIWGIISFQFAGEYLEAEAA